MIHVRESPCTIREGLSRRFINICAKERLKLHETFSQKGMTFLCILRYMLDPRIERLLKASDTLRLYI